MRKRYRGSWLFVRDAAGKLVEYTRDGWFARRERVIFCGKLAWRWALYQNRATGGDDPATGFARVERRLIAHYRTLRLARSVADAPSAAWLGPATRVA